MIKKEEIDAMFTEDLMSVLNTKLFYHYSSYGISIHNIILENTLKFSNPETFNDPFDCNEQLLKISINTQHIINALNDSNKNYTRRQRRNLEKKIKDPRSIPALLNKEKKKHKLACFSKIYDEVLMWSHYAEKHTGVCIGFEFPHVDPDTFMLCPIRYLDKMKPLDGETSTVKILLYWLTAKSERWSYENEFRAISNSTTNDNTEFIKYDKTKIKEIIFGCNVKENLIIEAMDLIKNSDLPFDKITFRKMKIDTSTFLLTDEIIKAAK